MKLAVEISMYPLQDNYLEAIGWFIEQLRAYPEIERKTNAMSTQIQGDYDQVMQILTKEMKAAHEKWGRGVFVCKFIPAGVSLDHDE